MADGVCIDCEPDPREEPGCELDCDPEERVLEPLDDSEARGLELPEERGELGIWEEVYAPLMGSL